MKRLLALSLILGLLPLSGHARPGDTLDKIKERFGKPQPQTRKEAYVWTFEASEGGLLIYTVTFDAKGLSVAEGLKPFKNAVFSSEVAQNFIDFQLEPFKGSKTLRVVSPGEKYHFGGKEFVCDQNEYIAVDETNRILLVWNRAGIPSVIVVRPEMV